MSAPLTLRVFLSSPGDVAEERSIARKVMEAMESSHLLRGRVRFEIVSWDDPYASAPMDARETPQSSVNRYTGRPADCDLALVILWSRIGTTLPPALTRPDGTKYESGTVWEYENALVADVPVFVYRRTAKPQIDLDDTEFDKKRAQYAAVNVFFDRFANQDGSLRAGFSPYAHPPDFERALRQHLEGFVNERLDRTPAPTTAQVAPDDPKVTQILTLIDELARKNRQLDEREAEIARLRGENERLSRDAIARTLTTAGQPEASAAARAAGAALEVGDTRPAEALLRDQERDEADAIAVGSPQEVDQRRQAAKLAREQGALAFGHDVGAALAAYQRAADYEPEDNWTQFFIGDLQLRLGNLAAAMERYLLAGASVEARLHGTPDDEYLQRDLSVSHERIGEVLKHQGDGAGALANQRKGLAIRQALAARDPSNPVWQRDLSVSHNKIGDVLVAQGEGPGALTAYRKGLTIREALAAHDPANTEWQRDLSVSHNKIGDVLQAQGDGPGALTAYRKGLAIAEALAARDPANTVSQRDLSVSHNKIGDVLQAQGDGPGALTAYRKGLAIAEALAARDPANTEWQRDLSISHERIGDVLVAQSDGPGALADYRKGLAIRETLAARDPANTVWQRDLSVSHVRIGDVLWAQGDGPGALTAYRKSLAIAEALAARDPANTEWQRDLSISHERIGDVLLAEGDGPGAFANHRKGLAIREALAARDPANTEWQTDVAVSCGKLGTLDHGQGAEDRRAFLLRGKAILLQLKAGGQLMPSRDWTEWFEQELGKLPPSPS